MIICVNLRGLRDNYMPAELAEIRRQDIYKIQVDNLDYFNACGNFRLRVGGALLVIFDLAPHDLRRGHRAVATFVSHALYPIPLLVVFILVADNPERIGFCLITGMLH